MRHNSLFYIWSLSEKAQRRIILQSAIFALVVSEGFILLGDYILNLFTITPNHFKVAGGILLLVLSVRDLLTAMALNILVTSVALFNANLLMRLLGRGGSTAISKIFMIVLSAYAVRMIVEGLRALFG